MRDALVVVLAVQLVAVLGTAALSVRVPRGTR
jgi:hypothetical protein